MPKNPVNTAFLESEKWWLIFDMRWNIEKTIAVCTQGECLQGLTDYLIMAWGVLRTTDIV